ncbi:helix-turn-helix domain-containing protein [Phyllobacterium sp. P5_D12]
MIRVTRNSAAAAINKDLGAKLRGFRLAAGISQIDLGASMGISGTQIQKYESGSNRMAVSTLIQFCGVLQLELSAFLGDYLPRR